MNRRGFLWVAGALLLAVLSNSAGLAGEARTKLKVLVVTGGHGFEKEPFFKTFQDNPDIVFTAATQGKTAEVYERADLLGYDVVVLYDMLNTITETQKAKFLSLFDKGVGLVVTHHALCSYQDWPEYERIIGGKYLRKPEVMDGKTWPASGYQHDEDIPVVVVAKGHPICAGVKDFTIHDETYSNFRVQTDVTPLLTTTHPRNSQTVAWTRTQGKSRVVFLQLGHDHAAYENPNYRRLLAQSMRWAARR